MEIPRYNLMKRILAFITAAFLSLPLFLTPDIYAVEQAAYGYLDLSLSFDTTVKDFEGDVSIVLRDIASNREYQYVFRQKQGYVLPDNPVKMIAGATYSVKTHIYSTPGVSVVGSDGRPVTEITVPETGAALILFVINDAAGGQQNLAQSGARGDLESLIPVMDKFYENTAYAVNGDMVNNLNLWTKGSVKERFLRDPSHTSEQWDSLTLYEKTNYLALTIIPFDVLFVHQDIKIDINDKSTFTKSLDRSIDYLKIAAADDGVYYNEVCKVADWQWDFYVQNHDFVNVIDEYAILMAAETANTGNAANESAPDSAAAPEPVAKQDNPPAQELNSAASTDTPVQEDGNGISKKAQTGLLEKLKENIIPLAIGGILLLIFIGFRKWNLQRSFQSEEKKDRAN